MRLYGYVADAISRAISQGFDNLFVAVSSLRPEVPQKVEVVGGDHASLTSLAGWYFGIPGTGEGGKVGADIGDDLLVRWDTMDGRLKTIEEALAGGVETFTVLHRAAVLGWRFYPTYYHRNAAMGLEPPWSKREAP